MFFVWTSFKLFQFKWLSITTILRNKPPISVQKYSRPLYCRCHGFIQALFSLRDIISRGYYLYPQHPIFSQMPIKYHPKYFILINPYLVSFLFAFIWDGVDILFTRDHRKVNSLIDWHYQAVRQTVYQVRLLFLCCCLPNVNRESDVLLPGKATIHASKES